MNPLSSALVTFFFSTMAAGVIWAVVALVGTNLS